MPAMTMPYKIKEKAELDAIKPGDIIDATLVIVENDAYLTKVKRIGEAPHRPAAGRDRARHTGVVRVRAAEARRDGARLDVRRSGRQEADVQRVSRIDGRAHVHLHEVPAPDLLSADGSPFRHAAGTPAGRAGAQERPSGHGQLRPDHRHAAGAEAARARAEGRSDALDVPHGRPRRHRPVRGALRPERRRVRRTTQRDISHNLRTAIVSPEGKLVKLYTGNEWTPNDILEDLKPTANAN